MYLFKAQYKLQPALPKNKPQTNYVLHSTMSIDEVTEKIKAYWFAKGDSFKPVDIKVKRVADVNPTNLPLLMI